MCSRATQASGVRKSFTRAVTVSIAEMEAIVTTTITITEHHPVVTIRVMFTHDVRVDVKGPERYQFMPHVPQCYATDLKFLCLATPTAHRKQHSLKSKKITARPAKAAGQIALKDRICAHTVETSVPDG